MRVVRQVKVVVVDEVIVFEPLRHIVDVIWSMSGGNRTFWRTHSFSDRIEKVVAYAFPRIYTHNSGLKTWIIPEIKNRLNRTECFLSDCNVYGEGGHNTGYNQHFIFTTEEEAKLYVEHCQAGGKKLPPTKNPA